MMLTKSNYPNLFILLSRLINNRLFLTLQRNRHLHTANSRNGKIESPNYILSKFIRGLKQTKPRNFPPSIRDHVKIRVPSRCDVLQSLQGDVEGRFFLADFEERVCGGELFGGVVAEGAHVCQGGLAYRENPDLDAEKFYRAVDALGAYRDFVRVFHQLAAVRRGRVAWNSVSINICNGNYCSCILFE